MHGIEQSDKAKLTKQITWIAAPSPPERFATAPWLSFMKGACSCDFRRERNERHGSCLVSRPGIPLWARSETMEDQLARTDGNTAVSKKRTAQAAVKTVMLDKQFSDSPSRYGDPCKKPMISGGTGPRPRGDWVWVRSNKEVVRCLSR
jgi:hypothetical protein